MVVQGFLPQTVINNILVNKDEVIDSQIIYSLEAAVAIINAVIWIYPIAQHVLDMYLVPDSPNK